MRQLRDGFSYRPHAFPQSIILCRLRDVRDYKIASGGSLWLVNALAREVVEEIKAPVSESINSAHFEEAAQRLILTRATHHDSLSSKLNEDRVRRVLEPLLAGTILLGDSTYNDDVSYVRDLGLITQKSPVEISNTIYKEEAMLHKWQREAFELKLWLPGRPDPLNQVLQQLERYLDGLSTNSGTLEIFDRRPEAKHVSERTVLLSATTPKGYGVRLLRA